MTSASTKAIIASSKSNNLVHENNDDFENVTILPTSVIIDHIFPFLDRQSWNNLSMANHEILQASKSSPLNPPWPETAKLSSYSNSSMNTIKFSNNNGNVLASAGEGIGLWDCKTGRRTILVDYEFHREFFVHSIAFSPQNDFIAAGMSNNTIKIWNLHSFQEVTTLNGHDKDVYHVTWLPCNYNNNDDCDIAYSNHNDNFSYHLASASEDGTIRLWDIYHSKCTTVLSCDEAISDTEILMVAFSPKLSIISHCWSTKTDRNMNNKNNNNNPNKQNNFYSLASCDDYGSIVLWDLFFNHAYYRILGHQGAVASIAFSPNGNYLASAGFDTTIRIWDLNACFSKHIATNTDVHANDVIDEKSCCNTIITRHSDFITKILFSADGEHLISKSFDRSVCIWNIQNSECIETRYCANPAGSLAVTPDGKTIAAVEIRNITLWSSGI